MWEESPIGLWTLEVINDGRAMVELKSWSIAFFGSNTHPQPDMPPKIASVPNVEKHIPDNTAQVDLNQHIPDNTAQVDLNQVKLPEQNTADVSKAHHGKTIADETSDLEPLRLEHCLEETNPDWCSVCEPDFILLNGRCVAACPAEGYYAGKENHRNTCLECYYSCKTCSGPNDYQVIIRYQIVYKS
jgi:hypothetical protein